ncbi:MAG: phosphatidylserine decarboxylase [Dehalococcoidia bacterium]
MEHPAGNAAERPHTTQRPVGKPLWRPLTEGAPFIAPLVAAGTAAAWLFPLVTPVAFAMAAGVALAFRDPPRKVTQQPSTALAPADGRVMHVSRVWDDYWQTELVEVAVFLALWDVHIQRSPLAGEIVAQRRRAGGYRPAMTRAATHGNNQLSTYLRTAAGPCTVTQISGMVARRIVRWARTGKTLTQGERLGMIKFGSQVTLRLPTDSAILVSAGDRVRAGITPVAQVAIVGALDKHSHHW